MCFKRRYKCGILFEYLDSARSQNNLDSNGELTIQKNYETGGTDSVFNELESSKGGNMERIRMSGRLFSKNCI